MSNSSLLSLYKDYFYHIGKVVNYSQNTVLSYKRDLDAFYLYLKKMKLKILSQLMKKL